jgi:hypothetical protein
MQVPSQWHHYCVLHPAHLAQRTSLAQVAERVQAQVQAQAQAQARPRV